MAYLSTFFLCGLLFGSSSVEEWHYDLRPLREEIPRIQAPIQRVDATASQVAYWADEKIVVRTASLVDVLVEIEHPTRANWIQFDRQPSEASAKAVYVSAPGGGVAKFDIDTKEKIWGQPILGHEVHHMDQSPNGELLAVGTRFGVVILDAKTGELIWRTEECRQVCFFENSEGFVAVSHSEVSTCKIRRGKVQWEKRTKVNFDVKGNTTAIARVPGVSGVVAIEADGLVQIRVSQRRPKVLHRAKDEEWSSRSTSIRSVDDGVIVRILAKPESGGGKRRSNEKAVVRIHRFVGKGLDLEETYKVRGNDAPPMILDPAGRWLYATDGWLTREPLSNEPEVEYEAGQFFTITHDGRAFGSPGILDLATKTLEPRDWGRWEYCGSTHAVSFKDDRYWSIDLETQKVVELPMERDRAAMVTISHGGAYATVLRPKVEDHFAFSQCELWDLKTGKPLREWKAWRGTTCGVAEDGTTFHTEELEHKIVCTQLDGSVKWTRPGQFDQVLGDGRMILSTDGICFGANGGQIAPLRGCLEEVPFGDDLVVSRFIDVRDLQKGLRCEAIDLESGDVIATLQFPPEFERPMVRAIDPSGRWIIVTVQHERQGQRTHLFERK